MTILYQKPNLQTVTNPATGLLQEQFIGKTGKPKLILSGSLQNLFNSCNAKFHFSQNFQNKRYPSGHAADVGTAIHEVVQHYLIHKDENLALAQLYKFYPAESDHQQNATYRSLEDTFHTARCAIENFRGSFPIDYENSDICNIKTIDGNIIPAVEVKFEIFIEQTIIEDYDIYIQGAMDLIMYAPMQDTYFVNDIKTHRDRKADLVQRKFEMHNQTLPYHLVLSSIANQKVHNFDVVYWTMFIDLLNPKIQFVPYQKTQRDIEDYLLSFIKLLHQIKLNLQTNHWPKNGNSCVNWAQVCNYSDACRSTNTNEVIQDIILGEAEPYSRYNSPEHAPNIKLEMNLGDF